MSRWRRWTVRRADRPVSCRKVGKVLQKYLDGATDEVTAQRVARHLEACRFCGLEAATYLAIKASLARQDRQLPEDVVTRLRAFSEQLVTGEHDHGHDEQGGPHGHHDDVG